MIKVCPLFSGSSGNSIYIELSPDNAVLIDAGRSAKQIEQALIKNKIDANKIKAVLITHEHTDHISGLKIFAKNHNFKIYGSNGTISCLKNKQIIGDNLRYDVLNAGDNDIKIASVRAFSIFHDCEQGFGYVLTNEIGEKVSICTDIGHVTDDIISQIKGSNTVVIESNHDVGMLQNGPYPYYLKRRILSDNGHLSNESCSKILPDLVNSGTKNIMLAHLSEKNNIPQLAYQNAVYELSQHSMNVGRDFDLFVAPKDNVNNLII